MVTRILWLVTAASLCMACGTEPKSRSGPASAPAAAAPNALKELIGQVRDMALAKQVDEARSLIEAQRPNQDTSSPDWLLAVSWLGRGAGFAERWDVAEQYASEARDGSVALLSTRDLDAERQLPLALGAGIEVLGLARSARGDRLGAVRFLHDEREHFRGTSIESRIQKNALLLSLKGQPFPVLDVQEHLGPELPSADSLRGKVVVVFFWAHWCPDCKRQLPVLEQLHTKHGDQVAMIGPTQLFGLAARGEDATPEQELAYLRGAYQQQHPIPDWMSIPVSQRNFLEFGVSTTPTLVLIDREGIVRLYNPGYLPYEELAPQIERLLGASASVARR
ncbi:MAG: TlpA disulfide reductase family protein [Acidobacteriota bacterium]